jgi:hypothetical protein
MEHVPFIAVEIVLVFGGAMAFAWWQFRDLARERKKRDDAKARAADSRSAVEKSVRAEPVEACSEPVEMALRQAQGER